MLRFRFSETFGRFRAFPFDFVGLGLILTFTPIIYLYGILYLIPDAFEGSSTISSASAYLLATWCALGILAHLYCVRNRKSSIQGRFLEQPVLATNDSTTDSPTIFEAADGLHRRTTQDLNKTLGQQFMAKPFGSDDAWHICPKCEVYVPNRCWHCSKGCNTCILRRDHHCVFAMACIGQENHANFLGLVLYLSIGTAYAFVMLLLYTSKHFGMSRGWFLVKSLVPAIFLLTDFSLHNFMCSLSLLGSIFSGAVFFAYFLGAVKGQTSADRKYSMAKISLRGASYAKLEAFLGPNPLWRIIWPFHPVHKTN